MGIHSRARPTIASLLVLIISIGNMDLLIKCWALKHLNFSLEARLKHLKFRAKYFIIIAKSCKKNLLPSRLAISEYFVLDAKYLYNSG